MNNAFNSEEREKFFARSGLPYWNSVRSVGSKSITKPYALYTCHEVSPDLLAEIRTASVLAGQVFDKVLSDFESFDKETRTRLAFKDEYEHLLQLPIDQTFCSRIGWADTKNGLKLLEINSEKPTFWIEAEYGNGIVAKHFGLKDPNEGTRKIMQQALNEAIERSLSSLPSASKQPAVGYVVRDNFSDLQNMRWLSRSSQFYGEALTINELDFTKKEDKPFNTSTGTSFDALIFWYPLEYIDELRFNNGEKFIDIFVRSLESKSWALVHGLAAFRIQPKSILAYITENKDSIFVGDLKAAEKYFPRTFLDPSSLGETYFAKPIWGREGRGCYRVINGTPEYGKYQDNYYVKQPKIYQELLDLPQITVEDRDLTVIYESWIYRVEENIVPGAIGIRASDNTITDDASYFLPIGL